VLPAVATVPLAAATPAAALAQLLAGNAAETGPDGAFGKLFALWGAHYVAGGTDPCSQALQQGLECFVQRGSFAQLRLYNRPAILMLNDDSGMQHHVVLTGLDDERARIDLGGTTHAIGIGELSRYWFGEFLLLWRPATHDLKPLSIGMRGEDVRRLRQSLQRLRGDKVADPPSDLFDAELGELVRDFQRTHRLTVDGVAGVQTLVVLNSATAEPDSPLLLAASLHGS
jgi:general secretion pathway protein A